MRAWLLLLAVLATFKPFVQVASTEDITSIFIQAISPSIEQQQQQQQIQKFAHYLPVGLEDDDDNNDHAVAAVEQNEYENRRRDTRKSTSFNHIEPQQLETIKQSKKSSKILNKQIKKSAATALSPVIDITALSVTKQKATSDNARSTRKSATSSSSTSITSIFSYSSQSSDSDNRNNNNFNKISAKDNNSENKSEQQKSDALAKASENNKKYSEVRLKLSKGEKVNKNKNQKENKNYNEVYEKSAKNILINSTTKTTTTRKHVNNKVQTPEEQSKKVQNIENYNELNNTNRTNTTKHISELAKDLSIVNSEVANIKEEEEEEEKYVKEEEEKYVKEEEKNVKEEKENNVKEEEKYVKAEEKNVKAEKEKNIKEIPNKMAISERTSATAQKTAPEQSQRQKEYKKQPRTQQTHQRRQHHRRQHHRRQHQRHNHKRHQLETHQDIQKQHQPQSAQHHITSIEQHFDANAIEELTAAKDERLENESLPATAATTTEAMLYPAKAHNDIAIELMTAATSTTTNKRPSNIYAQVEEETSTTKAATTTRHLEVAERLAQESARTLLDNTSSSYSNSIAESTSTTSTSSNTTLTNASSTITITSSAINTTAAAPASQAPLSSTPKDTTDSDGDDDDAADADADNVVDDAEAAISSSSSSENEIETEPATYSNKEIIGEKLKPDPSTLVQIENSLLSLFNMKRPPKIDRTKIIIPEAMRQLYAQIMGHELDIAAATRRPSILSRKANTVRSFTHKESKIDDRFPHHHRFRLYFDVKSIPTEEKLRVAELHLSRDAISDAVLSEQLANRTRYQIIAYDITRVGLRGRRQPSFALLDTQTVQLNSTETVNLNVQRAVDRWLATPHKNYGLLIEVRTTRSLKPAAHPHVRLRRSIDEPHDVWQHKQPVLYAYTDDGKHRAARSARDTNGGGSNNGSSGGSGNGSRSKRAGHHGRRGHRRKNSDEICRRHSLYVDFADVGWSDWIVAPPGYDAFYCQGKCPFPLAEHMNSTNHAVVQTLVNNLNPGKVPKACCVPTQLEGISMLYLNDQNTVVLKNYQDMTVVGCGCR